MVRFNQTKMSQFNDILNVAGGNKELQVDLKDDTKMQLGAIIFLAIALGAFVGVFLGNKLN